MKRRPRGTLELLPSADSCATDATEEGYQPFPLEALPSALGAFVREGAEELGCEPACLALPALAGVASAIGNSRTIRLKERWDEPCVLWSAIVGDGETVKSAFLRTALAPLLLLHKCSFMDFRRQRDWYEQSLKRRRDSQRQAVDVWVDPTEEVPRPPILRQFVSAQTNVEKLAAILAENPRGLLVAREDLSGWFAWFLRSNREAGGRDPGLWQEMTRAGPCYVERPACDGGLCFVPRAAVSLTGALAPGILTRALQTESPGIGLLANFLLAMPPRVPRAWSHAAINDDTEAAYYQLVDRLHNLPMDDRGTEPQPHVLTLSPEAMAAWIAYFEACEPEQAGATGLLAAALTRIEAYAARLAMIHHVVRCLCDERSDLTPIGPESVEAGVALARWFAAETQRVYAKLSESADRRNAAGLVDLIRRCGGQITVRELMRRYPKRYPDAATADYALARLVEVGLGQWVEAQQEKTLDDTDAAAA